MLIKVKDILKCIDLRSIGIISGCEKWTRGKPQNLWDKNHNCKFCGQRLGLGNMLSRETTQNTELQV